MAVAMTQEVPKLTFTVCDEEDETLQVSGSSDTDDSCHDEDAEAKASRIANLYNEVFNFEEAEAEAAAAYTPPDTEGMPASLKLALPRLLNIRKMSDHGIRQLRNQIRRMSSLTSNRLPRSWNSKADTAAAARLSTSTVGARKMSMDSVGILKQGSSPCEAGRQRGLLGINHLKLSGSRKCVSFCQRDNVKYYDSGEDDDGDADSDNGDSPDEADNTGSPADRGRSVAQPAGLPELRGKSLIPTFGFNCKKPNYAQIFEENVLILESLNITEDFCLMGNIRVNMTKLRAINREQEAVAKSVTVRQRASVFAIYTFDGWNTVKETKAMVVKAQPHPALKSFETHAMRFYIDCDDMEVGDTVEFAVVCSDKRQTVKAGTKVTKKLRTGIGHSDKLTTVIRKYRDDNEGQFYQAKCTRQLNAWAERAARELKNVTPIIKYKKY